jgi:hypothetical protein
MKTNLRILTATSAASLLVAIGAAWADPPRPVTIGQTVSGTLAASDAKSGDNTLYEDYTVRLSANQNIEALMSSSAFDAMLRVGRGTGTAFEELKSDDDSGGGTDARVRFLAPSEGVYTIRTNALSPEMSGAFSLRLSAYTPPPPPVTKPLTFGAPASGALAEGGPRIEDGDKLFDQYSFTAAAGDRVKIESKSSDFDSVVQLGRMVAGTFEELKSDDDSAGDKNARVLAALEQGGEYTVRVLGFDRDQKGAYSVSLEKLPPPAPAPRPKGIRVGEVKRGELTTASPTYDEFRAYDYYELSGRAGQSVTIIMRADYDAYLDLGVLSPGGFAKIASDDDSGGDTNAKIDFKFERSGKVIIRVSPLYAGAVGAYSLTVE